MKVNKTAARTSAALEQAVGTSSSSQEATASAQAELVPGCPAWELLYSLSGPGVDKAGRLSKPTGVSQLATWSHGLCVSSRFQPACLW